MKTLRESIPEAKWAAWKPLSRKERALQIAAYLCDVLKVRESGGHNRGETLDAITRQAGYDPADAYPWCAMFVSACLTLAGYQRGDIPSHPGAVVSWAKHVPHILSGDPKRGDLVFWLNPSGTGHIGLFVRKKLTLRGWQWETLEGNTGPGEEGDQREGDGAYRRLRKPIVWRGILRLPE